jgi:hypothetical protein
MIGKAVKSLLFWVDPLAPLGKNGIDPRQQPLY